MESKVIYCLSTLQVKIFNDDNDPKIAQEIAQELVKDEIQDNIELWGGAVNWRTAMTYDAVKTIAQGLESASTRQQLQETLATPQFSTEGATASINFLASGDRNSQGTLIKIEPGAKSETGYDFVSYQP